MVLFFSQHGAIFLLNSYCSNECGSFLFKYCHTVKPSNTKQPSSCSEQNQTAASSVRPSIWSERLSDCVVVKERKGGASLSPHPRLPARSPVLPPSRENAAAVRSSTHPPSSSPPPPFLREEVGDRGRHASPAKRGGKHVRPLLARGGIEGEGRRRRAF